MSEPVTIPLSATEEAFTALIFADHARLVADADALKQTRLNVLLKEKGIPDGVQVAINARTTDGPASVSYTP